jgi:uncharacterized membrane protein YkoI
MRNKTKLVIAGVGVVAVLGGGSAIAAASAAPTGVPVTTAATTSAATAASAATTSTAPITRKQAIEIAEKKVPGAWVTDVEREWEHGHRTWKIELEKGNWEYDVYVAISDGKIIKFKKEYDD